MLRTQIYLPEELHRDLTLLAKREGRTISQLIREGAVEVLEKKKKSVKKDWRKFVGSGRTNIKTNAVKIFHDYYKHWTK